MTFSIFHIADITLELWHTGFLQCKLFTLPTSFPVTTVSLIFGSEHCCLVFCRDYSFPGILCDDISLVFLLSPLISLVFCCDHVSMVFCCYHFSPGILLWPCFPGILLSPIFLDILQWPLFPWYFAVTIFSLVFCSHPCFPGSLLWPFALKSFCHHFFPAILQ